MGPRVGHHDHHAEQQKEDRNHAGDGCQQQERDEAEDHLGTEEGIPKHAALSEFIREPGDGLLDRRP